MKLHTIRLKPGKDLKLELENFVKAKNIQAGFIITCVGGLSQACMRMAGALPDKQDIRTYKGDYEITSLVGTVGVNGVHLHMAISDSEGKGFGGHLKEGTIIHPTAEIVIGEDEQATYTRELDEETGFPELVVSSNNS
ncbi:MAG TPA: PPC domain-containing DNA-binding protein [Candidatus Chromulinivoraceae bacterium]|nr:PPC domain-containing DNA-binding protein [Candidatus Chromulinivoraceae bacterium]